MTERVFLTRTPDATSFQTRQDAASEVPVRLLRQGAKRLRTVALIVVLVTLVSWVGINLIEGQFLDEFITPFQWAPPMVGLLASLAVLLLTFRSKLTPTAIINFGLVYEVFVSYSMALGQYWNVFRNLRWDLLSGDVVGVSAVGLWMIFFTVLVPAKPRRALVALILAGSAVPVTMGILIRTGNAPPLPPSDFFFIFVFPYIIIIVVSTISARVIYGLGKDVGRAQRMGSYELLELIGRGGMGEVWKARHNFLARPAAVKLIRRDALGSDPATQRTALARFEREAQVTSGLQSQHTVELYDFGVSEEGTFYYVMELLDGLDLDSLVKRHGPVPPERVAHILGQVCASLEEAHRRGLIHRDIKPANILLCEHAFQPDFVKILDFGLVKPFTGISKDRAAGGDLTRAELVAGTPAFLAPEIATGKGAIDGRADIYSLGCVAFWLLAGRPLFEEDNPVAMIVAHTTQPPPRPSRRTELPVPPPLDDLILACLAKEPGDRPESAAALARRLNEMRFESPWTLDRARDWWNVNRQRHGAATALTDTRPEGTTHTTKGETS